jgi:outer membrane lipoprotein-sorting protein
MLKKFSLLLVIIVTFSFRSNSQTVDEIIEANLKASGTKEKMDSIKSLKIVLNEKSIDDYNSITFRVYTKWFKAPDKFKSEYLRKGKKIYFGTDGNIIWGKNEFASNPIAGESRFNKTDNKNDLIELKAEIKKFPNGILPAAYSLNKDSSKLEFLGVVDIDNKKYNKIKITYEKSRYESFIYIDAITNLQYKFEVIDSDRPALSKGELIIAEYQKSDGIFVPRKVIYKINDEITNESIFQSIIVNAKIADEFFKMPKDSEPVD